MGESGRRERFHNVVSEAHTVGGGKVGGWGVCSHCLPGSRPEWLSCWSGFSTNLVDRAFNGFLIPLLGLIVFPYATLFYVLA